MYFCPNCCNILMIKADEALDRNVLSCRVCPYICPIDTPRVQTIEFQRKEVDDILGGADAWENVDKTDATCPNPKCGHKKAFYFTMQIRSADEPSTIFYRCCKCGYRWNE